VRRLCTGSRAKTVRVPPGISIVKQPLTPLNRQGQHDSLGDGGSMGGDWCGRGSARSSSVFCRRSLSQEAEATVFSRGAPPPRRFDGRALPSSRNGDLEQRSTRRSQMHRTTPVGIAVMIVSIVAAPDF